MLWAKQVFDYCCHPRAPLFNVALVVFLLDGPCGRCSFRPLFRVRSTLKRGVKGGHQDAHSIFFVHRPSLHICTRCVYRHVYVHAYVHIYIRSRLRICVDVCICIRTYLLPHVRISVCMHVCARLCFDSQCQEYPCVFPVYVQSAYSLRTVCVPVCNVIFHSLHWF